MQDYDVTWVGIPAPVKFRGPLYPELSARRLTECRQGKAAGQLAKYAKTASAPRGTLLQIPRAPKTPALQDGPQPGAMPSGSQCRYV